LFRPTQLLFTVLRSPLFLPFFWGFPRLFFADLSRSFSLPVLDPWTSSSSSFFIPLSGCSLTFCGRLRRFLPLVVDGFFLILFFFFLCVSALFSVVSLYDSAGGRISLFFLRALFNAFLVFQDSVVPFLLGEVFALLLSTLFHLVDPRPYSRDLYFYSFWTLFSFFYRADFFPPPPRVSNCL